MRRAIYKRCVKPNHNLCEDGIRIVDWPSEREMERLVWARYAGTNIFALLSTLPKLTYNDLLLRLSCIGLSVNKDGIIVEVQKQ